MGNMNSKAKKKKGKRKRKRKKKEWPGKLAPDLGIQSLRPPLRRRYAYTIRMEWWSGRYFSHTYIHTIIVRPDIPIPIARLGVFLRLF